MRKLPAGSGKRELSGRELAVLDTLVEERCSLLEALRANGYTPAGAKNAARRYRELPELRELILEQSKAKLGTSMPELLRHALHLAFHSKSQFVQAEMTRWLLERAGLEPVKAGTSVSAGDLTLNIIVGPEGGWGVKNAVDGYREVPGAQFSPSESSSVGVTEQWLDDVDCGSGAGRG